jgi:NAD(P)-dependent dehydrogenase (short-subunit alcohol dehydrogenase family)
MRDPGPILVTGCSSGIGHATAERLHARGWTVYATARRLDAIEDLPARKLQLDVTDEESMRAAIEEIEREHGAVGALVNNAGYSLSGAIEETPLGEVRRQFETNVFGLVRLTQLVLPGMRRARTGRIVNVSSMGGRLTFPGGGFYHATKHAVEALSDAMRYELGGFGIGVVVVQPGLIRTAFGETAAASIREGGDPAYASFQAAVARATRGVYEGRLGKRLGGGPETVARTIERALGARRPRTRYRVTPSASVFIGLRRTLPDRAWDRMLRSTYPRPR